MICHGTQIPISSSGIRLGQMDYMICQSVHNQGGKSVAFNLASFSKEFNFNRGRAFYALKRLLQKKILVSEGKTMINRRGGAYSHVLTLIINIDSLEKMGEIKKASERRYEISPDATVTEQTNSRESQDIIDQLTLALQERAQLKETVPELERQNFILLKEKTDLQNRLEKIQKINFELLEKIKMMNDTAERREQLLKGYLNPPRKVVVDGNSGVVLSVK